MTSTTVDRRRTDTKARIVAAALELFAARGYAATSVADIERAVGLTPGAGGLYRHYRSKEEVLDAAVVAYLDQIQALRERLRDVAADRRPRDARAELRRVLDGFVEVLGAQTNVARLGTEGQELPGPARSLLADAWDEAYGILAEAFVRQGMTATRAMPSAVLAVGSLHHYIDHVRSWGRLPNEVDAASLLDRWLEVWSSPPP